MLGKRGGQGCATQPWWLRIIPGIKFKQVPQEISSMSEARHWPCLCRNKMDLFLVVGSPGSVSLITRVICNCHWCVLGLEYVLGFRVQWGMEREDHLKLFHGTTRGAWGVCRPFKSYMYGGEWGASTFIRPNSWNLSSIYITWLM